MAWTPITGAPFQYSTSSNELASGYYLKLYDAGTTNPYSMATDSTGSTRLAKCKLNTQGYPITDEMDDTSVFIPHVDQSYRIVLYTNATDADNDTTSNAAYNVDNVAPDVAQLATSADISMKGTTLQVQDDYDRSPLFVDGTDFTAGAGPHVITVPAAWTPTNSDMRFYKLASNGVVTILTPTSTSSTTFTIAETLLSTDTLFIGDNTFRNQMDGDPADIRTRLDVYSTAEADTEFLNQTEGDARYTQRANNLSDVSSVSLARSNLSVYSKAESDSFFIEDVTASVSNDNLASSIVTAPKVAAQTYTYTGGPGSINTGISVSGRIPLGVYADVDTGSTGVTLAESGGVFFLLLSGAGSCTAKFLYLE